MVGSSRPFPYADRIRTAFGAHAPEGLRAHFGPAARAANERLSSDGYVWNGRAAFSRAPDLHTAAHEAAHLVHQQQGGVGAAHGVGAHSDRAEAFADRVADAVAAGRSAETMLASAPRTGGANGGAVLQMKAKITQNTGVETDTPWAEIDRQLKPKVDLTSRIETLATGLDSMMQTLGDTCRRAQSVTAEIQGSSSSHLRQPSQRQTAYGNLGKFEELITRSPSLPKYQFHGGHLISDHILDTHGDVEGNFAPQRAYLNSPIFRKIEQIGEGGLTYVGTGKPTNKKPTHTMTTTVSYPSKTHEVPTKDVLDSLQLENTDIDKSPSSIKLTTWVPNLWKTKVKAPQNYVFNTASKVDSTDGAWQGFHEKEDEVENQIANTTLNLDSNAWSMDTLRDPAHSKSGDGRMTQRSGEHTFTAIQSVPRKGLKMANPGVNFIPAPTPLILPTLKTNYDFDQIAYGRKSDLDVMAKKIYDDKEFKTNKNLSNIRLSDIVNSLRTMQLVINKTAYQPKKGGRSRFRLADFSTHENTARKKKQRTANSRSNQVKKRAMALQRRQALSNTHLILAKSLKVGQDYEIVI